MGAYRSGAPRQFRRESQEAYWKRLKAWEQARYAEAVAKARGETWLTSPDPDDQAFRDAVERDG